MDLEQQLRETYAERLGTLETAMGDAAAARRTGERLRVRRRLAIGAAAVGVLAAAAGGTLFGTDRGSIGPSEGTGEWRELPAPPLSPRTDAQGVWTGQEVVVVGGETQPCPPNAVCASPSEELRDGAAYAPATDRWRRIADAPVPVGPGDRLVPADGEVVLRHWRRGGSDWFLYDPEADDWSRIRGVPDGVGDLPSALGSGIYVMAGRHVAVYSVRRDEWSTLPSDPIEPPLRQRRVTATSAGAVVTGYDSTQPDDGRSPSVVLADVWDGDGWHRLPATGQLDNNGWFWTGARMVDPDPTRIDGGEVNPFPHVYPAGGILDPTSGSWGPLPEAFVEESDGWGVNAAGGRWVATYGQVYDTETGRVWTLPRPDGAPDLGTTAVWTDDALVAFGGVEYGSEVPPARVDNHAWLYAP